MKQKILFVLPGFTFGGTVFSTLNMISLLDKEKYDIDVLAMTHQGPVKEYYESAGINILPESIVLSALMGRLSKEHSWVRKISFYGVKILRRLCIYTGVDFPLFVYQHKANRIQSKSHYDYVASCQEFDATYFASCFPDTKRIAWFRNEYSVCSKLMTKKDRLRDARLYHRFDQIVCVSQTTRDDFASHFNGIQDKVVAIHNIQNVENIEEKASAFIDDPFEKEIFNIVSVGRFAPQKRFPFIPGIAAELKKRGLKFKWHIIGDGNVAGEWDKTQANIKKYDVADCVECMGSRLNPYPYIASADLSVTPSSYEACPRVVIEAKILKTPCICADFSSAREFVSNDVDGYVDTIDTIVEPISKMISDKDTYNRINNVCKNYQIDNDIIYAQLQNVFKK